MAALELSCGWFPPDPALGRYLPSEGLGEVTRTSHLCSAAEQDVGLERRGSWREWVQPRPWVREAGPVTGATSGTGMPGVLLGTEGTWLPAGPVSRPTVRCRARALPPTASKLHLVPATLSRPMAFSFSFFFFLYFIFK